MKKFLEPFKVHKYQFVTTASKPFGKRIISQKNQFPFLNRIRWFHVPLSFVLTLFLLRQLRKYRIKKYQDQQNHSEGQELNHYSYKPLPLEVSMYKMLPLRTLSRIWGWINSIELPQLVRIPILKSYVAAFGCDLNEAWIQDLTQYKNLNEFFRRELKPNLRPIAGGKDDIVSPCDGTILHMGSAKDGLLEQVKGITYMIESFLGPITWKTPTHNYIAQDYQKLLLHNDEQQSDLYHCIIYLAPGDYHRFHSPVNWTVKYRRHFPGKLYSVKPTFASWFPNLFAVNERVAYMGEWKYGFFAMVPVGALNVGSMLIYFDQDLRTNRTQVRLNKNNYYEDKHINNVQLKKGDPFGEFNMGSTVIMIFEAPKTMKFEIQQKMKIKYGQLISNLSAINNHHQS